MILDMPPEFGMYVCMVELLKVHRYVIWKEVFIYLFIFLIIGKTLDLTIFFSKKIYIYLVFLVLFVGELSY